MKELFSRDSFQNRIGWLIITISLFVIAEYYVGRLALGPDQTTQYVAAKQLISGNGLTRPQFNPDDLAQPVLRTHTEFPPGLALFFSPFFLIPSDIHVLDTIFAFVNIFLFLFLAIALLKKLIPRKISVFEYSLILFFLSLNGLFVLGGGSADLICISLFILSAIYLIDYFQKGNKIMHLALSSLFLVLTVYFRYAYLPALLVLPAFFLWRMLFLKKPEKKELFFSVLFIALFSIPFLGHIFLINSETNYIANTAMQEDERMLYWENLVQFSPFPFQTFFDIFPIQKYFGITSEYGYDRGYEYSPLLYLFFYAASLFILIPVIIYYSGHKWNFKKDIAQDSFALFSFIFSAGLIALIIIGSIINPSQRGAFNWSWAKIFRYFLLPAFFIQLTYLLILLNKPAKFMKLFSILLIVSSFSFAFAHKAYNYKKNYKPFDLENNTAVLLPNDARLNVYQLYQALPEKEECQVAFIDPTVIPKLDRPNSFLSLKNITTAEMDEDFDFNLKTSAPVIIYLILDAAQKNQVEKFSKFSPQFFGSLRNNMEIYQFTLYP